MVYFVAEEEGAPVGTVTVAVCHTDHVSDSYGVVVENVAKFEVGIVVLEMETAELFEVLLVDMVVEAVLLEGALDHVQTEVHKKGLDCTMEDHLGILVLNLQHLIAAPDGDIVSANIEVKPE